ncbi:unnamed protein product [Strongylus vulgaris]|uniref:Uncharacterized protein n=1 Tax=Strongylus vulgaris TaxID=40348 RepID=A0A3P7KP01_STRVU|nr:unnamed protein product [Strongylus vulgaris]
MHPGAPEDALLSSIPFTITVSLPSPPMRSSSRHIVIIHPDSWYSTAEQTDALVTFALTLHSRNSSDTMDTYGLVLLGLAGLVRAHRVHVIHFWL